MPAKKVQWALAADLWEKALDTDIARALGCTRESVFYHRKKFGIPAYLPRPRKEKKHV